MGAGNRRRLPEIVFTLNVDIPDGIVDFPQNVRRISCAGEDVDSVVTVEEGKAEGRLADRRRGVDERVTCNFITTKGCAASYRLLYRQ